MIGSNRISEGYLRSLKDASAVHESIGTAEDLSALDQAVMSGYCRDSLGILRDLLCVHYSVIHPLLRIHNAILKNRILQYSASIQNAPKCSGNCVYADLKAHFFEDDVVRMLAQADMTLVGPFQSCDEAEFVSALGKSDETVRDRLCAVSHLCGRLTSGCEEYDLSRVDWDDSNDVTEVLDGLTGYVNSSFQHRLLKEVIKDDKLESVTSAIANLCNASRDHGDIQFYEQLVTTTEELLSVIVGNFNAHRSGLAEEETRVIDSVLSREIHLAQWGKIAPSYKEVVESMKLRLETVILNKYDDDLPFSVYEAAPRCGDGERFHATVGISSVGLEKGFANFKILYNFLVREHCISDSLANYRLMMLRFTGKVCESKESETIVWMPIDVPGRKNASLNGARRLYFFVSSVVGTGAGRSNGKLKLANKFFTIGGKEPSVALPGGDEALAATRVDSAFENSVKDLLSKI